MIVVLVSVLVYAISFLLLRALSRYREFAADRGSAVLTGRPSALASALMKISGTIERMPSQDLRTAEGMSAFFIIPARAKKSLMNIFADHPPLEQRLAALERLESQLQSAVWRASGRRRPGGPARHPHGPPHGQGAGARPPVRDHDRLHRAAGRALRSSRPGSAAIVFQALATSEFEATLRDMEEVVKATGGDTGTTVSTQDDAYGYRWMVLRNPDGAPSVEDLAVGINAVSSSIETAGHGERLLCAVFAFTDAQKRAVYFIYNYKRGFWYPFVPAPGGANAALDRARAAAEGADGRRTADRARTRALVPAVGHPDLASGIRPSPVNSRPASANVRSGGGRIRSEVSISSSPTRSPCART